MAERLSQHAESDSIGSEQVVDREKAEAMATAEHFDRSAAFLLKRSGNTRKAEEYLKRAGLKAEEVRQEWENSEEWMRENCVRTLDAIHKAHEKIMQGNLPEMIIDINDIFPELASRDWETERRARRMFNEFFGIQSTHHMYNCIGNDDRGRERVLAYTTDIDGVLFETRDPQSNNAEIIGPRKYVMRVIIPSEWGMELKRIDVAEKNYQRKMEKSNEK